MSRRSNHGRHGRQASVDIPKYPPQIQPQAQVQSLQPPFMSDYESDNQGYISDYPTGPPPANRTDAELNLSVLKRHNPDVSAILSIAAYAVVYEFCPVPEPIWSKTGVEGTLFICQLTPGVYLEDRYSAMVLNRRGLNNFEIELREADDGGVEVSDPYVIVSCKEGYQQKIYGVFIFSEGVGTSTEQARIVNAELMKKLSESAGYSRRAAETAAANAVQQHNKEHMQEAESTAPQMGRQISLQELFGQQRKDDAGYSVKAHNLYGTPAQSTTPARTDTIHQQNGGQIQQPDVLGDLFRRAGLT